MKESELQAVEKKVFQASVDHGAWDIYLGLMVLAMGVSALLEDLGQGDSSAWFIGIMALALGFFFLSRRLLIEPRLGRVRFGPKRKANLGIVAALVGLAVLIGLALWWLSGAGLEPGGLSLAAALWVVLSLGIFSAAAYLLDFPRLYLYGVLFAAVFSTLELIPAPALRTIPTLFAGALMLVIGSVLFARFLIQSPRLVVPEEESHGPQ